MYGWSRAPGFPPVRRLVGFGQYLMTQNKSHRQATRNQSMSDWLAEGAVSYSVHSPWPPSPLLPSQSKVQEGEEYTRPQKHRRPFLL